MTSVTATLGLGGTAIITIGFIAFLVGLKRAIKKQEGARDALIASVIFLFAGILFLIATYLWVKIWVPIL